MIVSTRASALVRVAVLWVLWHAGEAVAQPATSLTIKAMKVGDCQVVVGLTNPRAGDQVGVVVELTEYREQTVIAGRNDLAFALGEPLRPGFRVKARLNGADAVSATVPALQAGASSPQGTCAAAADTSDDSPFDASAFFGEVVDNFAPDRVGGYKNPEAGSAQKLQSIFGIDFDYRALGRADSRVQFWINGETMHGVRTADINCKPENPDDTPPVCAKTSTYPERARYILENATSLEAFVSPRVEFHTLQSGTESPANLYVTLRLGFIALKEAPSVFTSYHAALGLVANEGNFAGSYFEAGWGKNELFSNKWDRLKIDGLLSFSLENLTWFGDAGRFFIEMMVDNDRKDGPDSVRTFFGVDVDVRKAFGQ